MEMTAVNLVSPWWPRSHTNLEKEERYFRGLHLYIFAINLSLKWLTLRHLYPNKSIKMEILPLSFVEEQNSNVLLEVPSLTI